MNSTLAEVIRTVSGLLRTRGLTVSVAESCTGGLISHYLTTLPGASVFFVAGVVAYSAETKQKILGVSSGTIAQYGIISGETAREMAEKMRVLSGTTLSLSTTGILGPDALEGKEKGLVYVAVSREKKTFLKELHLQGERERNKEEAAYEALRFLAEIVETPE